ncbi:MAG: toll/interleukin-1 receptor domain-containing protein [Rhodospirillales bacterium]|nr:toll/interleukin-1 receptor domain-containing protein [Rhodospirillales bacterium]
MTPNIFISYQNADSALAAQIAKRLKLNHSINIYLDKLDPEGLHDGPLLAEQLTFTIRGCSHIMAVVSRKTRVSWWVPWEIGIATASDKPIAVYGVENTNLPSYLMRWPYLSNFQELDTYAYVVNSDGRDFKLAAPGAPALPNEISQAEATSIHYQRLWLMLGRRMNVRPKKVPRS